uniref:Cation_ATPase_C domain-containing protein n=1 Tax=Echinostoma caproni TaxID=27848 RepID=A0A183AJS1_9TREM
LTEEIIIHNRILYESNEIYLRLTPILVTLISECLNPFYCFQAFSCALWLAEDYWTYASCILLISVISLVIQVYEVRRNERALKSTICGSAMVTVCRDIDGVTGESVPVTKTPLPQQGDTKDEVFNLRASARHVLFGGTSVIQTRNYADEKVLAVVARTGFRTAKGELVRAILFPKPLKFKFTQDAMKFVAALACVALIGFAFSVYYMHRSGVETHLLIIRALDLITIAVPPALPMAMTIGVVFAQRRLREQSIYCINPSVINVCGVINVTCFDKTGTLTEDGLDLWGVVPALAGGFGEPLHEPAKLDRGPLLECMATCHSLTRIEGVLSGDPLDLKMFQSTNWEFMEQVEEDHRKFAMAVLSVVRPMREILTSEFTCILDASPEKMPYEAGIVRQFAFTSTLQRMSVVARVLGGQQFHIYTKGAPETIELLCRRDTVPPDFHSVLMEYTRAGYRVLALAWRPLKITYARVVKIRRERVEQDLSFLGLLIMENRLKPETAPVIEVLRNANIRPIMVTGDNMLTALSVARDCVMIDELDRIVIVSAQPPTNVNSAMATGYNQEQNNTGPETSTSSHSPRSTPLEGGQLEFDKPSLVQFHYAEDLHKPVTEVTTTKRMAGSHRAKPFSRRTKGVSYVCRRWFKSFSNLWSKPDQLDIHSPVSHDTFMTSSSSTKLDRHRALDPEVSVDTKQTSSQSHRVDIRMLDRSDFHLAISGKMWAVIRDHYPWLIPKLVVKGTVFARFSPDQKTQLIEALQSVGYYVAMCGDGANDCGALKAAHAGVSLSEAEASVASPFTTKQQNVSCIPTLIREGRCALVTSFGTLKFMIGYSLVQFFSVVLMYYVSFTIWPIEMNKTVQYTVGQ